jgi:hypothetical protein
MSRIAQCSAQSCIGLMMKVHLNGRKHRERLRPCAEDGVHVSGCLDGDDHGSVFSVTGPDYGANGHANILFGSGYGASIAGCAMSV